MPTASILLRSLLLLGLSTLRAETFNVKDFGAKGDGITFDTTAIQNALNACAGKGGVVRIPPGTYLSKPLEVRTKTTLQIDKGAVLMASPVQSDWMKVPGDWLQANGNGDFNPFLGGKDLTDVTLTGEGIIDGQGKGWWGEAEKLRQAKSGATLPRPNLVVIPRCRNLKVENITLRNSPKFHLVPTECEGVVISNVTILAPERAANTDAIDPSNCKDVLITKCLIDVGDDNIAIKSGRKVQGRDFGCEDITVTDCVFKHGHGMSIGSETVGGVRRVRVRNCTFENTENGIRIKSAPGKGGIVEDITYDGLSMTNVNPAITLTCAYHNNSAGDANPATVPADDAARSSQKLPVFRNISVSNLKATCQRGAGKILGLPESKVSEMHLKDVEISAPTGFEIRNASGISFSNVIVKVRQGEPFLLENASVSGLPSAR